MMLWGVVGEFSAGGTLHDLVDSWQNTEDERGSKEGFLGGRPTQQVRDSADALLICYIVKSKNTVYRRYLGAFQRLWPFYPIALGNDNSV